MPEGPRAFAPLDPAKFKDPRLTAKGEPRARVAFERLETLWFNTGSLCNIACGHCYMESGPTNDALAYLTREHALAFLDEIQTQALPTREIGFTGGEPFMNKALPAMIADARERGFEVLVLTNAMKPLWNARGALADLKARFGAQGLTLRVSIDHATPARHEQERGPGSWAALERSVKWLNENGFTVDVAGRTLWEESEDQARRAYRDLFAAWDLDLDAFDPTRLVLFPEMDDLADVPEITTACWSILNVSPQAQMCATSRMVVWRKGEVAPKVVPCTLLPYDPAFDLGDTLSQADKSVALNHPHCAKFCVLGGASCSTA